MKDCNVKVSFQWHSTYSPIGASFGKLTGHLLLYGWLCVAAAFVKCRMDGMMKYKHTLYFVRMSDLGSLKQHSENWSETVTSINP